MNIDEFTRYPFRDDQVARFYRDILGPEVVEEIDE